jgi:hypothetical protein
MYSVINLGPNTSPNAISHRGGYVIGLSSNGVTLWDLSGHATLLQGSAGGDASVVDRTGESAGFLPASNPLGAIPARWSADGALTLLSDPGGYGADVQGMNANGDAVGASLTSPDGSAEGVLWRADGSTMVLGQSGETSDATSINLLGEIGGMLGGNATLWASDGSVLWSGVAGSEILQINASGQAIGQIGIGAQERPAVAWSSTGVETVLENPFENSLDGRDTATALNAKDQIVGFASKRGRNPRVATEIDVPLEWSASTGKATALPGLPGMSLQGRALAINSSGAIVGYNESKGGLSWTAVLWSPTGKVTDLGAILGPRWSDTVAVGIDDRGDITGYGTFNGAAGEAGFIINWTPSGSAHVETTPHGAHLHEKTIAAHADA